MPQPTELADQSVRLEDEIEALRSRIVEIERDRDAAVESARVVGRNVDWRARALSAERERDEARAKAEEASALCGEFLKSYRIATETSDGYRDAHAAYQRWAAKLAPDAIGDEQKRAAIDTRITRPPLDPALVEVLQGMLLTQRRRLNDMIEMRRFGLVSDEQHADASLSVAALEAVLGEETRRG